MKLAYAKYILNFKEPAGTSRGVLLEKPSYFIKIWDENNPEVKGFGEISLLPDLSIESPNSIENKLKELKINIENNQPTSLGGFPALKFGLEQAIHDHTNGGKSIFYPSEFTESNTVIPINGLIWMGSYDVMRQRIKEKIDNGFTCIKIKIGAINWDEELELIAALRKEAGDSIEIRVDANGSLDPKNCLTKLEQLSKFKIHSIEQPIPPRNFEMMRMLCGLSPIPIALDEELIGIYRKDIKEDLLEFVKPAYIILKPSLCGGFSGTTEWIEMAESKKIGWWITSALESTVGLDALSQFVATLKVNMPQGLGTGNLYSNNFNSPLKLERNSLRFAGPADAYRKQLEDLEWI